MALDPRNPLSHPNARRLSSTYGPAAVGILMTDSRWKRDLGVPEPDSQTANQHTPADIHTATIPRPSTTRLRDSPCRARLPTTAATRNSPIAHTSPPRNVTRVPNRTSPPRSHRYARDLPERPPQFGTSAGELRRNAEKRGISGKRTLSGKPRSPYSGTTHAL